MEYIMKERRVNEIVSNFPNRSVLVVGDVGIDKYTHGRVDRISPEAPVPIVTVTQEVYKLGLASNVADNIKSLGGRVRLCGLTGQDLYQEKFFNLLKEKGIDQDCLIVDPKRHTCIKERIVANIQQLVRIDYEEVKAITPDIEKQALEVIRREIDHVNAVIIEDYAKGFCTRTVCNQIIELAKAKGKIVGVDPNIHSDIEMYRGCSVITPNTAETEALLKGKISDEESVLTLGRMLLDRADCRIAMITRGRQGVSVFVRDEKNKKHVDVFHIPTFAREVYDVSGAGDTVISMFVLSLVSGATVHEAAVLANFAAGVVVGKAGTATVAVPELLSYIDSIGKLNKSM